MKAGRFLTAAVAADGPALAEANRCTVRHATDNRVVGPSFKEIAGKYKAADQLNASIKGDSSGQWGAAPMPPSGAVDDADAHALAVWILSQ